MNVALFFFQETDYMALIFHFYNSDDESEDDDDDLDPR